MKFEKIRVYNFEGAFRGMRNPKNSWDKSDSFFERGSQNPDSGGLGQITNLWAAALNLEDIKKEEVMQYLIDNGYFTSEGRIYEKVLIGPKDMQLAKNLIRAGSEHRKFMREIVVSMDITAPMYFWSEYDTYKVGTVANSTSKMHKLASTPITIDCFETDDYTKDLKCLEEYDSDIEVGNSTVNFEVHNFIKFLEYLRKKYLETKDKRYWKELIRWLPESWSQTRTVTLTYENLLAMCGRGQRRFHKLNEWSGVDDPSKENFISMARTLPYAQDLIFIDEKDKSPLIVD